MANDESIDGGVGDWEKAQEVLWERIGDEDERDAPFAWETRVARTLQLLRDEHGWSQAFAAKRLEEIWGIEMHQTTLAKLEAGKRPVRLAELYAFATMYGVSVTTVLALAENQTAMTTEQPSAALDAMYFEQQKRLDAAKAHALASINSSIELLATQQTRLQLRQQLLTRRALDRARAETGARSTVERNRRIVQAFDEVNDGEHQEAP
jgi:transcriptional regulator with XRE-family HTH domain